MKKIIFILFAVISWQNSFSQTFTYEGTIYEVTSSTTVKVANQNGLATGNVSIPTEVPLNGVSYAITSIGNSAFQSCSGLAEVTIPNSITIIGSLAFQGCTSLTSVIIPNSVTTIGPGAFSSCTGLTSVTLSNSLTSILSQLFINCISLSSVSIPSSVTAISNGAFRGCTGLTSVIIPSSVTGIGNGAFRSCSNLRSVTIPSSVTIIGDGAFDSCSSLTSITIPSSVTSISQFTFYHCFALQSVTIPNSVTSISNSAFDSCSSLTSITVPSSVRSIGDFAFYNCNSLTSVVCDIEIPLSINSNVFVGVNQGNCSLTVPHASIAAYQAAAVWRNFNPIKSGTLSVAGINYVVTSSTTVAVGINASTSGNIVIPETVVTGSSTYTVTSIVENAFEGCSGLTSVSIPDSVTSIGGEAFAYCSGLTTVNIPNSLTRIEDGTFEGCSSLQSIAIPNSVSIISSLAFGYCSGLTSVTIPDSVSVIGPGAFAFCTGLVSVTIPNSVIIIAYGAFYDCSNLTSVICNVETPLSLAADPSDPYAVAYPVFGGSVNQSACTLTVPTSSIAAYQAAPIWQDFGTITCSNSTINSTDVAACGNYTWANNGKVYTSSGVYTGLTTDCVIQKLNLTLTAAPTTFTSNGINYIVTSPTTVAIGISAGINGNVMIPASLTTDCDTYAVTSINDNAFMYNNNLTSIIIPNTITSIGNGAFLRCSSLTSVTLPNTVTSISESTFYDCIGLTSITIPNSVTNIGSGAFYGCSGLESITIPNSVTSISSSVFTDCVNLLSVVLPNSVTRIETETFINCWGLKSVTIPDSVNTIGPKAFSGCTGLTTLTIPSSVTYLGDGAFFNCSGLTSVRCNIATPLPINETTFEGVNQGTCSLKVADVTTYKVATIWKDFAPITCSSVTENATTISECGNYIWAVNGQIYDSSGTYSEVNGCHTEILILTINPISSIPNLSLIDQHGDDVTGYLGLKTQSQTFTAGATGNLDKISLYLGNPNGDASATTLTVQVYEGSGTTGTVLGSQTYNYPAQWGYQNTDFNFSNIAVFQGQQYTFKLSTPSVSQGFVGINTDNTYAGGALDFAPTSDIIFKTYVLQSNKIFCQGATVNDLKADGTNIKWYNAASGGDQLSSTALLETGTYFASQTGNSCESERVAVNVLVNPTTAITTQPAATFICAAAGSTSTFSVESNAVNPSYTWQYRVASTANLNPEWITITSANAAVYANFDTATLTVTKTTTLPATGTQYRVLVSGTCGDAISNSAPLTILSTVKAGKITSAASVCIGSDITLSIAAYAGSSLQWQSSPISTTAAPGEFTNIDGATGTTYTIAGATATMDKSYRVIVTNSCANTTATTAIKTLKVNPTSVAGTVTGGGIVCSGSNGTLKVTGNIGTIQWQSSADGRDFVNVTGTAVTYTASNITEATFFRAKITSGLCSEVYSNVVRYTIETAASAGTLTVADATVCSGTGTTLTLAGSVGTIKWFKSTNWTTTAPTWTAVTTSTSDILALGNLTVATAYKAEVTIGSCSTVTTEVVPVLVFAAPVAQKITANVTSPTGVSSTLALCSLTPKVLTIGAGYTGTVQWQKSTTSSSTGFTNIADENGMIYKVTNPAIGVNFFRAKFTNFCGVEVYSPAFAVYYKDCPAAKTKMKAVAENAEFKVIVSPNPYSENFNLSLTTSSVENVKVLVYDMIGKLLDQREVSPAAVSSLQVGANYPSGVYNVFVTQGENMKTLRIIKQ